MTAKEEAAKEWVGKENPDCESVEHWVYLQRKAFLAGVEWARRETLGMLRDVQLSPTYYVAEYLEKCWKYEARVHDDVDKFIEALPHNPLKNTDNT